MKSLAKLQAKGQDDRVVIAETVAITSTATPMKEYLDAIIRHGGLFDQAKAARVAGVSPQRIHQLVDAGRLPLVNVMLEVEGHTVPFEQLVPADALFAWMKEPRQTGRPRKPKLEQPELQAA